MAKDLKTLHDAMVRDAQSIKEALACSAPGHDHQNCSACKARLARIRDLLRR